MRVLFFAHLKDVTGVAEMELRISKSFNADELWRELLAVHPKLATFRKTTRLARNSEYADDSTRFSNNDEVALIPPVSGG